MSEPEVILVDEQDRPLGRCGKLDAHQDGGRLHRAFSVFLFNSRGEMLLQRRSPMKYHFGGLWTNACCSHPGVGQDVKAAAEERLEQEMGFRVPLLQALTFTYRAEDPGGSGLVEYEFDHVFVGHFEGEPRPDPQEVDGWRWTAPQTLMRDIQEHPERYTPWFRIALERVLAHRG